MHIALCFEHLPGFAPAALRCVLPAVVIASLVVPPADRPLMM